MLMVKMVYQLIEGLPRSELHGLSSQIKRSAVSVPSNIAEGSARSSDKDFVRFLFISNGSIAELLTQIEIAVLLNFIDEDKVEDVIEIVLEIQKMNYGLINRLSV